MNTLPEPINDPTYPNIVPGNNLEQESSGTSSANTLVESSNNGRPRAPSSPQAPKASRQRSIIVKEPTDRPSRSRAKSDAKGSSKLGPLASRTGEGDEAEGPDQSPPLIRVPTFNNRSIYFSSGGKGSALRKYASEGAKVSAFRSFSADDPRARRGLPGLFSLVSHEHFHADEVGYRGSMYQEHEDDEDEQQSPGSDPEKRKTKEEKEKEKDPNLVVFDGPDDPLNPQNWSSGRKYYQTLLLGLSTLVVTFASSVFSSATTVVAEEFNIGTVTATLGTSLFVLGYAVGPLIWGPASEFAGRKYPLMFSYAIFAIFAIPVAVAQNVETIFICRFIGGIGASGPLAICGGALADFWEAEKRGGAIAIFALSTFGGPAVGPVVGSFITKSYLGWRWTQWITLIWAAAMLIIIAFTLKESYVPLLLSQKAKKMKYETKNWAIHSKMDEQQFSISNILTVYAIRPLKMLVSEVMLLLLTIYTSLVYGILYLLFSSVPLEMQRKRGILSGVASLPFIAVFVGAFVGCCIVWSFVPRYNRRLHELKAISVPEERMIPMMIGAVIFPVGLFMFGWTDVDYVDSVWPSIIALGIIGCGIVLLFLQAINYIIDAYLMHANSALAGNTFMRSFAGAGFPLFAVQMFNYLGVQWASTLLGGLATVLIPVPVLFYLYGKKLRHKSKFAFA